MARTSGYLDAVDLSRLCRSATQHDARVELLHPLGTFVPEGSPLAMVHLGQEPSGEDWSDLVRGSLALRRERSMAQDASFGFRRLVDIADRALSPGVNDPTTAVQVIDQLHDLLRRMVAVPDPYPAHLDDEGVVRVVTRDLGFADYLDLAIDEIAHWGGDSLQVPRRLELMLEDLTAAAGPDQSEALRAKRMGLSPA